jgi:hypothetical protein
MEFDAFNKDAHAIFFPERAPMILMLVGVPVLSLLPTLLFGLTAGASFACTLALYYLSYEVLHLAYHAHPDSFLGRLPGVPALRHHHMVHHDQALMGKWNFNITWPSQFILFHIPHSGRRACGAVWNAMLTHLCRASLCLAVLVLVLPLRSLRLSLQHNLPRRLEQVIGFSLFAFLLHFHHRHSRILHFELLLLCERIAPAVSRAQRAGEQRGGRRDIKTMWLCEITNLGDQMNLTTVKAKRENGLAEKEKKGAPIASPRPQPPMRSWIVAKQSGWSLFSFFLLSSDRVRSTRRMPRRTARWPA